ncbi:MAG: NAD-dependent epimerase/dehydratase family protein, partial [Rhodothermaceae bacterium]|nr:NAD-dependent epimerase/dehydratase family protein [Rhodothermaceae bacterium]
MRALVTGGHGFIGSHLVRLLMERGAEVRCLYRRPGRPAALAGLDVEVVPGDIRRSEGLDRALRGVDEVYHLAGLTSSLHRAAMD